jgi:hypothetical protein
MGWLNVPAFLSPENTFVINGFFACDTAVRQLVSKTLDSSCQIKLLVFIFRRNQRVQIAKMMQEAVQAIGC